MSGRTEGVDPHFLHGARALDALVSPPIEQPRALAWLPDGESLLVAAADGTVWNVEPSFGSRVRLRARPDPALIAVQDARAAVLGRDGTLQVWDLANERPLWEQPTGLIGQLHLQWWRQGVAVVGEDLADRRAVVFDFAGNRRARARLPARTALGVDAKGRLIVARSLAGGLHVGHFGQPLPADEPTQHTLRFCNAGMVLGVATGGVTVWRAPGAPQANVKLYDVTAACLDREGEQVALGTRSGEVALASALPGRGQRVNPSRVEGHEGAVVALAFAPRGRWLASVADRCWVWGR